MTKSEQVDNKTNKPKDIDLAIKLFYAVIGLRVLLFILTASGLVSNPAVSNDNFLLGAVLFLGLLFWWFIIRQIGKRKNWSRFLYLIWFGIREPLQFLVALQYWSSHPIFWSITIVIFLINTFGLILLFKPRSRDWFKKMPQDITPPNQQELAPQEKGGIKCSFCYKYNSDVKTMVTNLDNGAAICSECSQVMILYVSTLQQSPENISLEHIEDALFEIVDSAAPDPRPPCSFCDNPKGLCVSYSKCCICLACIRRSWDIVKQARDEKS